MTFKILSKKMCQRLFAVTEKQNNFLLIANKMVQFKH